LEHVVQGEYEGFNSPVKDDPEFRDARFRPTDDIQSRHFRVVGPYSIHQGL
jgi:hypothetical protein